MERIRDEIRRGGPMPFARFMELALYDPDGGYYRSHDARPGRGGDFLTAPELHPIFGEMLARAVEQAWERLERPDPFVVVEHGAGEGALATSLLDAVRDAPLAGSIRYRPVEVDEGRMRALRDRLETAGLADRLEGGPSDAPFDGVVLANEVLDALPVHRVRRVDGELRELAVDCRGGRRVRRGRDRAVDGRRSRSGSPPTGIELVDGQTAEICLALDDWIARAAAPLRRGLVLLIDYGAVAAELYDPVRRRDGTLRAYVRHQVHDDPYRLRRAPGPDRARRRDGGRASRGRRRPHHDRDHDPGRGADGPRHRGAAPRDPGRPGDDLRGLHPAAIGPAAPPRPGRHGPVPVHGLRPRLAGGRGTRHARLSTAAADRGDRPTRANAVLPRRGPRRQADRGRRTTAPSRGARREPARALGASRSPLRCHEAAGTVPQRARIRIGAPPLPIRLLLRRGVPQRLADPCRDPFEGVPADRMAVRGGSTEPPLPAASDRSRREFDWNSSGTSWASPSPA